MNNDQQFWTGTYIAVVLMVVAAVLQVGLSTGWTTYLVLQGAAFSLLGVSCVYLLRAAVQFSLRNLRAGPTVRQVVRGVLLLALLCAGGYGLLVMTRADSPAAATAAASDPLVTLAGQLSQREWALSDESCSRDGIRFMVEGRELVAYPKGASSIRFALAAAAGHRLTTNRDGSPVVFEIRGDGFTYVEGGHARWYVLCR